MEYSYGNKTKDGRGADLYFGTVFKRASKCKICVSLFYDVGEHNEMEAGGADWNDALDMAWDKGESVRYMCICPKCA